MIAAAAYRAGVALHDERLEMAFDYRGKGGIEHAEIMAPEGAPASFGDRGRLWNAAEAADKRVDSRPAREILVALPHELNAEQRRALVRDFIAEHVVAKGMVADVSLHVPDKHGDQRNHHAHVLVTTREVTPDGFGRKVAEWTSPELVRSWRSGWEAVQNRHLEQALGREAPKVSAKSLADRGLDRKPTIHLGPAASAIERRGEASERGEVNRAIGAENTERRALGREVQESEDALVSGAPKAERSTRDMAEEFASLHQAYVREHAELKVRREGLKGPPPVRVADVRGEVLGDAERAARSARACLALTQKGVEEGRAKRASLHRWITNPARMIWAKHAALNRLDCVRREHARAVAQLRVRQQWLGSEAGQAYVARRVEPAQIAAAAVRSEQRTLERRMRRVAKRADAVLQIREKLLVARELGHKSLPVSTRTLGMTQFAREVDRATMAALKTHAPERVREARGRLLTKDREAGRVRGRVIDLLH